MRRSIRLTGMVLALVGAGCDTGPEAGSAEMAAAEAGVTLPEVSCEPSERMDLVGRASPYDSATIELGEGVAKVCYGRPSLKGRTMIGGEAVPYDTLWRTGANEPTTIHLNVPASIAGLEVEPGSYSLYTIPRDGTEWTLIVNRSTSQWGHESTYTEEVRAQEVGRVPVEAERLDSSVEQLTIRPVEANAGTARAGQEAAGDEVAERPAAADAGAAPRNGLLLEWQNTRVHIPIAPVG